MQTLLFPAVIRLRGIQPYPKATLTKHFDYYINSNNGRFTIEYFQEYMDHMQVTEKENGPLDKQQLLVETNKVSVRNRAKRTPEDYATPDHEFLPVSGLIDQVSKEYIVLMQFGDSQLLVTEVSNLDNLQKGQSVPTKQINVSELEIINFRKL